jgi:alpha-L-rhamnosidase
MKHPKPAALSSSNPWNRQTMPNQEPKSKPPLLKPVEPSLEVNAKHGKSRVPSILAASLVLAAAFPSLAVAAAETDAQVTDLRCEYLKNPLGIDTAQPRLSWRLESNTMGQKQTAYQVLVASSREKLDQDLGDLWDSGRVASDQSIHIACAGKPLESRMGCHWKVRVWDKDSRPSRWSEAAIWSMGLLKPADWTAKWITMDNDQGLAHPWMRRTFELNSEVRRAEVYVNTPSHYELYVNGEKVENEVLVPAHHQHKRRFLYNTLDVSAHLRKGRNCIALWMGPGWYQPRYGNPHKAPIVRLQLDVQTDGGLFTLGTDAQWRVADSCISQINHWGWNQMGGERWDDGRYIKDWNQVKFDDRNWAAALEVPGPGGQIEHSWQAMPGSRMGAPIKATRVYPHKGKWVVDFGTTLTGWMRLRLAGLTPGQTITIDYSDMDNPRLAHMANRDGFQTFNQQDVYVAGKEAEGEFCSKFNQHAFRYAVIAGLANAPALTDAEAFSVYSDLETAGEFECSNELFNQIHRITVATTYSQIPCGALGGGEAREKLGYGDGGSFLTGVLYNLRSDAFYTKWLRDWCDNQGPDGFLGHTAPEFYPAGGGPSWGGQASELVRRLHLYYGDERAMAHAYATLKSYLAHLESNTQGDILRYFNPYQPGTYKQWYFLGDWVAPGAGPDRHGFIFENELQREFFNNCYRVLLWEHLANYADVLGDEAEALRCRTRLAELRPLIHTTYYDPATKSYKANRQAYLTIALLARVMPEELRPAIFKQLEDDIVIARKGHLDTGLQGTSMLLDLLTRENRSDLVARMMNQTTFPGWGFLVKERKVTTWPETWSGWGSQIIHVVGTPGAWFYEGLAGIRPDPAAPGFKNVIIKPAFVGDLTWVKCHHDSPYGRIVSNWKLDDGKLTMEVTIPPNSTGTVYVPGPPNAVTINGVATDKAAHVTIHGQESGRTVLQADSGSYTIAAPWPGSAHHTQAP